MGNRFISLMVTVMVVAGLLLVPAVSGAACPTPPAGKAGICAFDDSDGDALVRVTAGSSFAMNITVSNDNALELMGASIFMTFDDSLLNVTDVENSLDWPDSLPENWNNTEGWLTAARGVGLGSCINSTPIHHAVVQFESTGVEGTTVVAFGNNGTLGYYTRVDNCTAVDVLDGASLQNVTVQIGTPKLTVDVTGNGDVDIAGLSIPPSYPNLTEWSWDQVVNLQAIPDAGWGFVNWTGGDVANPNAASTSVTMDALAKSATANFEELPPDLDVDPNSLSFSARFGDNEDNDTVEIANDGGGTLCWALGTPPILSNGDNWAWGVQYGAASELMTMVVIDDTDPDVYTAFVSFTPSAARWINVTQPPLGPVEAVVVNATVEIDKCTHSIVKQDANLIVNMSGVWVPANATLEWNFIGCHEWPYAGGKQWAYLATQHLWVMGVPNTPNPIPLPMVYCAVTGYTNVSGMLGPLPGWCWETTHFLNPMDPANSTFMQTYWSESDKTFAAQFDAGTYLYPPPEVRMLLGATVTPEPAGAPAWLSFDKSQGSLGIGGSETLTVTANTSGLAVGIHNGSFIISACGSVQTETVDCTLEVLEATTIDVIRDLPADALDLDAEYPGDTFSVYVNFTAPVDDFNSIGLTDLAPAGWEVTTDVNWCNPVASWTMSPGNKAEYAWSGPYSVGQNFTARYDVLIPATADVGLNDWPDGDCDLAWAEYWFGAVGPFESCVTGEWQKLVTVPGTVCGETRDVNADLLTSTMVVLNEEVAVYEDDDSSTSPDALYCNDVDDTGLYWQNASKYCYFNIETNAMPGTRNPWHEDNIDFSTVALLAAGYVMDFEGDYGLVPRACTMSYAMESVNHWLFIPIDGMAVPHSEWQLSNWKAMESVHSWQFPAGCNL